MKGAYRENEGRKKNWKRMLFFARIWICTYEKKNSMLKLIENTRCDLERICGFRVGKVNEQGIVQ